MRTNTMTRDLVNRPPGEENTGLEGYVPDRCEGEGGTILPGAATSIPGDLVGLVIRDATVFIGQVGDRPRSRRIEAEKVWVSANVVPPEVRFVRRDGQAPGVLRLRRGQRCFILPDSGPVPSFEDLLRGAPIPGVRILAEVRSDNRL
jgi:hypothetical protein